MFRAIITYSGGAYIIGPGNAVADHTSIAAAKEQLAKYLNTNKATFQAGYDAFIIDLAAGKIASRASLPVPTLTWTDAA